MTGNLDTVDPTAIEGIGIQLFAGSDGGPWPAMTTVYVDSITISGDVGVGKPDPKIFQAALDGLAVQAEKVIMVGNSLKRDIAGAQQAGIRAVWVNRPGAPCREDIRPDGEITTLSALPDLLGEFERQEDG